MAALASVYQEDEEESLVLTSVFTAATDGNVTSLEELLQKSEKVDVNSRNRVSDLHLSSTPIASSVQLLQIPLSFVITWLDFERIHSCRIRLA